MTKCLVTKLNGSISNQEIFKLGEVRIKIHRVANPCASTQKLYVVFNQDTKLEIIGDGYFTDVNLSLNKGKTLVVKGNIDTEVYVSNGDFILSISNKYALKMLSYIGTNKDIEINFLKYSTELTYLNLNNSKVSGDIADLSNLTALEVLNLYNTLVSGDIADLKNLTALTRINLSNFTTPIIGDIGSLHSLESIKSISLQRSQLSGDLANIPTSCIFISLKSDAGSTLTWGTRPSSAKIIAIEGNAKLENIDKMLQDQSQCQVGFSSGSEQYLKTISVVGTRTSASDEAVQTLQSKGYTVSITPA